MAAKIIAGFWSMIAVISFGRKNVGGVGGRERKENQPAMGDFVGVVNCV